MPMPLVQRKAILADLVAATNDEHLQFTGDFEDPIKLLGNLPEDEPRGIVSRRKESPYRSGPTRDWLKIKTASWRAANSDRQELFEKKRRVGSPLLRRQMLSIPTTLATRNVLQLYLLSSVEELEMPYTPVTPAQFELLENGVVHLPTNARFTIRPGGGDLQNIELGGLGSKLTESNTAKPKLRRWHAEFGWHSSAKELLGRLVMSLADCRVHWDESCVSGDVAFTPSCRMDRPSILRRHDCGSAAMLLSAAGQSDRNGSICSSTLVLLRDEHPLF
jgi:hypothetical protein